MRRRMKQIGALVLAGVLTFSALAIPKAYAALGVVTDEECSLEIKCTIQKEYDEVSGENVDKTNSYDEVSTNAVTVNLYKVASIDVSGMYTSVVSGLNFSDVDSETTAAEWKTMAETAKENVSTDNLKGSKSSMSGTVTFENLETGLYLVDVETLKTAKYEYTFAPYLVSLPNNYYSSTNTDDTWQYNLVGDLAVGLKPERTDRYGDLLIKKTLDVYNATNSNATFVFQVEAIKTDVDDPTKQEVVYSNVVSTAFNAAGTKEILIEKIPAGAEVTVTEIYSGASYTITSEAEKTTVIKANEKYDSTRPDSMGAIPEGETNVIVSSVEFTNTHDGRTNGGSGVINNFKYDDSEWRWDKIDPETGESILKQE